MNEALDRDAYSMFLVLEDKTTPNFEFRQFFPDVEHFVREADPDDEMEIFLIKNLDAPLGEPDCGDAELLIKWAICSGRAEVDILPYQLDDLIFGIGILRKLPQLKKSPLPAIKRVMREHYNRRTKR